MINNRTRKDLLGLAFAFSAAGSLLPSGSDYPKIKRSRRALAPRIERGLRPNNRPTLKRANIKASRKANVKRLIQLKTK